MSDGFINRWHVTEHWHSPAGPLVGVLHQAEVPLDVVRIVRSGIRVHGVFRYANIHPVAVDLVRAGRVSLEPFVTHSFPLQDVQQALEFVESHKDQVIKGVILI